LTHRQGGMPFSIFAMMDSVMTRLCIGALWQVPARRFEAPGRGASSIAGPRGIWEPISSSRGERRRAERRPSRTAGS
jgi:hypothetical protein